MTERYSDRQPAAGCFWMMAVGAIVGIVIWALAVYGLGHLVGWWR